MAPSAVKSIGKKKKRRRERKEEASTSSAAPSAHGPRQRKRKTQRERALRRQVHAFFFLSFKFQLVDMYRLGLLFACVP
jgi:hypothetical protein